MTHFLTLLEEVKQQPENTWLETAYVVWLYVIHNAAGIHAAKEALHEFRPNPQVKPSNDSLMQLLEFVLTKNNFKFTREHYLQVGSTSMGTKTAVALLLIWPPERTHLVHKSQPMNVCSTQPRGRCTYTKFQFCSLLNYTFKMHYYIYCLSLQVQLNLTCKSSKLVYCITCKTHYVWQTKTSIAQRFSSHFFNIWHKKQTDAVGLHFSQTDNNGTADVMINILEFICLHPFSERVLSLRLKIEKHFFHQLCCPAPRGLNICD